MTTKQLNVRLPEVVIDYLNQFSKTYGSQAKALIVAIGKLKQEIDTMQKKYNQKPFRRSEVDPNNHNGWVVDLYGGTTINPDAYWHFRTRKQAQVFIDLLNAGYDVREAQHIALGVTQTNKAST